MKKGVKKQPWLPAQVNILLTAVKMHGQSKGFALASKRLKRSNSACANKYYTTIEKLEQKKQAPVIPPKPQASVNVSGPGFNVTKGKLVAKGDNLLVVQKGKEYILIEI